MEINQKRSFVGKLYYDLGKQDPDFKLAIATKKEDNITWSKWKTFLECHDDDWFIEKCNNRSILKNELVLDVDEDTKKKCEEKFNKIIKELKTIDVPFRAYKTGSKGYHIHMYHNKWFFMKRTEREESKRAVILHFGCDLMKANDKTMIAIENMPHWKTGNIKELVMENGHWE